MKVFPQIFNTRATDEDPLQGNRFIVTVDRFSRAGFMKMSALDISFEEITYREGGDQATKKKRPGLATFADLTFERGTVPSPAAGPQDLSNWVLDIFNIALKLPIVQPNFRRSLQVQVYTLEWAPFAKADIKQAWVKNATVLGEMDATASANLIEKMVVAHEGFQLTYV